MNRELRSLLKPCIVSGSTGYTHSSQFQPDVNNYSITNDNLIQFNKLYCSLVHGSPNFMAGIGEHPHELYGPLLCDFDIKVKITDGLDGFKMENGQYRHLYTKQQQDKVIETFKNAILEVAEGVEHHHLACFVLEKTVPYNDGDFLKSGFHLHWPFFFMRNSDLEIHITTRVKDRLSKMKTLFDNLDHLDLQHNGAGDFIDIGMNKKNWLLYGSRKSAKALPYTLSRILDSGMDEISLHDVLDDNKVFDVRDEEVDLTEMDDLNYYLPLVLSIKPYVRPIYKAKPTTPNIPKSLLTKAADSGIVYDAMPVEAALLIIDKLVPLLSAARATKEDKWMKVGWCLFHITSGCLEGYQHWEDFSKRTTNNDFSEAMCVYKWNGMNRSNGKHLTMGSLKAWAKEDSPVEYEEFVLSEQALRVDCSLLGGHNDLTRYLHTKFSHQFVCTDIKSKTWYYFNGMRWVNTDSGSKLYMKIEEDMVPHVIRLKNKALSGENVSGDTPKKYNKIISDLKNTTFKHSLLKEASILFLDSSFASKLDEDPNLLGFDNGVLDLRTVTFRPGKPTDYLTKSCGYDYPLEKPDNCEDVMKFWMQIIPDDEVRQFFLKYCGAMLQGGNPNNLFLIMSGVGENGKSMSIELIRLALGEYAGTFPTTLLTGKEPNSSSATPELFASKGKRFMVLSEPDKADKINTGVMKRLTGCDTVNVRGLYEKPVDMKPQFKLVYVCNSLPKLPPEDYGTWRRMLLLTFESRFPALNSSVPLEWEEQYEKKIFYRDPELQSKLNGMKQAMMYIMVRGFRAVAKDLLLPKEMQPKVPLKVSRALTMYQTKNDHFLQFINEMLVDDAAATISLNDFYAAFKTWYHENYTGQKPIPKSELREDMEKKWGELGHGMVWTGRRLKTNEDMVDV
jgi:P4 family phage/plasmid primase-like protien